MDFAEFQRKIQGAPFLRVAPPPEDRPSFLQDFLGFVDDFLEDGWDFAASLHKVPLNDSLRITTQLPPHRGYKTQKDLHSALLEYVNSWDIPNSDSMVRGLILAILFGVENYIADIGMGEKKVPYDFFTTGCLFNQLLTLFLIDLRPEDRQRFWQEFCDLAPTEKQWRRLHCGALAAARLAYAMTQIRDVTVFLPPLYYDLHHAGDLVAVTPRGVLYLQVKARRGEGTTCIILTRVDKEDSIEDRTAEDDAYIAKLKNGARQFEKNLGIPVIPVYVKIFLNWRAVGEIENCSTIMGEIAHFLERL